MRHIFRFLNLSTPQLEPLVSRADVWAGDTECDAGQIPADIRTDFSDETNLIEGASSEMYLVSKEGTIIGTASVTDVSGWTICRRCCAMRSCSFSAQHPTRCKDAGHPRSWLYGAMDLDALSCRTFEDLRMRLFRINQILRRNRQAYPLIEHF